MILLRKNKLFVDREENDSFQQPKPFPIDSSWISAEYPVKVVIEDSSSSYQRDYKSRQMSPEWRKEIKNLRRKIKAGYMYEDCDSSERTHYYPSESSPDRYYISKDINPNDRLMYDLYKPKLIEIEGEQCVVIRVVLRYCAGHTHRNGKKFSQVDTSL